MANNKKTTAAPTGNPHTPTFNLREPQKPLLAALMRGIPNLLAAGSSRVGKSWLFAIWLCFLCDWYPGSRHGVFRRNRNACDANLFKITFPQVLSALGLSAYLSDGINKSDLSITFPNGSVITFWGLDENNRDRILGSEFQTIWMNEVSEFDYEDVEFLKGRLYRDVPKDPERCPPGMPDKLRHTMLYDCNPDTFDDWDYKLFNLKIHPLTRKPLQAPQDYEFVRLITDDQDYIRRNIDQTDEWKQRFIHANWQASNPNAMFQRKYLTDNRCYEPLNDLRFRQVVVGVDPAVTANEKSDYTGIVVAGLGFDNLVYVLADYSVKSHDWEERVLEAYDDFGADLIVAERNNGGDLVKKVIYQARRNVAVEDVWASRNKQTRAKPIADKYRLNMVKHLDEADLTELETQMCAYDPMNTAKSPDRLDALVWALWKLFEISDTSGPTKMSITPVQGYWR